SKEAQAFHLGEVNPEASLIPLEATDRGITALRPAIVRRFRSGDIRCLVSVLLLTEGFDAPEVDCLFLARPTYSTLLFSQMIGRGMRGPAMGGTERCILVNFVDDFVQIHQDRHQMLLSSHGLKTGLDVLDMDARDMDESEIQRVIEEQNRPSLKSRAGRLLLGEWFS
ncbi:MAG: hypothetical protein KDK23_14725, partial [Leptospiraceae bacterium]|nr:hypothetical protein [Leptospiraceae bacterium]